MGTTRQATLTEDEVYNRPVFVLEPERWNVDDQVPNVDFDHPDRLAPCHCYGPREGVMVSLGKNLEVRGITENRQQHATLYPVKPVTADEDAVIYGPRRAK